MGDRWAWMPSDRQPLGHFAVCDVKLLSHGQLCTGCMLAARGTIPCTTACSRPCMSPEYEPGEHGWGWWEEGEKKGGREKWKDAKREEGKKRERGVRERGGGSRLVYCYNVNRLSSCFKGNLFCFKGTPNPVVDAHSTPTVATRRQPHTSSFFAQRIIV